MAPELLWLSGVRQQSPNQPLVHGPRAGAPKRRELVGLWAPFAPTCSPDVIERDLLLLERKQGPEVDQAGRVLSAKAEYNTDQAAASRSTKG